MSGAETTVSGEVYTELSGDLGLLGLSSAKSGLPAELRSARSVWVGTPGRHGARVKAWSGLTEDTSRCQWNFAASASVREDRGGRSSRADTGERSKSEGEEVNFPCSPATGGGGNCRRASPSSSESEPTGASCSGPAMFSDTLPSNMLRGGQVW